MTGRTADGRIETVRIVPDGSAVANYGFDVTPARLITGLITERGVIAPDRARWHACSPSARARRNEDHRMSLTSLAVSLARRRKAIATALAVARGTTRLLHSLGFSVVPELPLASGRRADLVALAPTAKSGSSRSSPRWPIFAPTGNGWTIGCTATGCSSPPRSRCRARSFRPTPGLIVADAFGASIVCEAPEHRLHAATRKSVLLAFARAAALRLSALADPAGPYGVES